MTPGEAGIQAARADAMRAAVAPTTVYVISHDQGVDGGRAVAVNATLEGAIAYVEQKLLPVHPNLKRDGDRFVWDSLGDTIYIECFEVGE